MSADREFDAWAFTQTRDGRPVRADAQPFSVVYNLHQLIACGQLSPAAEAMSDDDICHQYNEANGGEVWLSPRDADAPWVCRRTEANPDGSDPQVWAWFVWNADQARMWTGCGQADTCHSAVQRTS